MEVLFIGGYFDYFLEDKILKNSKKEVHYAANKFQKNLIDGFRSIDEVCLSVLSAPFIGAYPKDYKSLTFNGYENESSTEQYVSFNNLWGYKNISRLKNLKGKIAKFANINKERKVIIIYSTHTPFLQAANFAKKIDPNIHICLIVPDLPQYMNLREKSSKIYKCLKKIDINIFEKNIEEVDSFVILTKYMVEALNIKNKPYQVVEGIVNSSEIADYKINETKSKETIIVYTGTINKRFGIIDLVKAFNELQNEHLRLHICGTGDAEQEIVKYEKIDKRITYFGQVSNKQAVQLQKNATILVNPRNNKEEFTKYSFPSKNMEYLLTGNPVLSYKLDGIPDEYDEFLHYIPDTLSPEKGINQGLRKMLELDDTELAKIGKKGRQYVIKNNNNEAICMKIIEMINKSSH